MELSTALVHLAHTVDAAQKAVSALDAIRAHYSDEEYEALEEQHPLLADLIASVASIEDALAGNGP